MSCSGHHFSVHSPDCKAHMSIQSNRPIQVEASAPGALAELQRQAIDNVPATNPADQRQLARWGSPYSLSSPNQQQHLQVIQPASVRCRQQAELYNDQQNDSDYTLVILDCSPTPNAESALAISSACRSPGECCTDENCGRQSECQHNHLHHTTELVLRQQHVDCRHHHHHHHHNHNDHNHPNQGLVGSQIDQDSQRRLHSAYTANYVEENARLQQQQQRNKQQIYGSGSIADRSESQTTIRSERDETTILLEQPNINRQPLKQLQQPETTTRTIQSQRYAPSTQQQQQSQSQWFEENPQARYSNENYYEQPLYAPATTTQVPPEASRQQRGQQTGQQNFESPWSQQTTTVKTVVTTNTNTDERLEREPMQPREGTRIVKRWNWNKAEFVEEEVPDKPRPKPQPAPSAIEQRQRKLDAWNEEIRQNIVISPIAPQHQQQQQQHEWLQYRAPDEQSVQADPLYRDLMAELQRLEEGVTASTPNHEQIISPDETFQKPVFGQHIQPNDVMLDEHETVEFICRVIPSSDPTMRVEWTLNGRPLLESSRLTCEHDFGVVRLLIRRCEAEDSGVYQCRAINSLGEAVSRAKLLVRAKNNVQCETLHPAGLDKIRQLENPPPVDQVEEQSVSQPPKFLTHIADYVEKSEGDSVHLECCLAPVDDPDMRTEWFFNGRPLVTGSRFHTIDDFGFIVLDIDWLYPRDTGEYVCRATNKHGTDVSRSVLRVRPDKNIVLDSQLAENADATIDKLRQLEFPDIELEPPKAQDPHAPAHFLMPLQTANNKRDFVEGDNCHFEARVGPATDGELTVEWFHNDKPLISGHRFKPTFDFGHILLDILYVYPEDSGVYKCLARNQQGESVSTFEIAVKGKPALVYQSQLPKEMVGGVRKIEEMEAAWNMPPPDEEEEAPAERLAPQFVLEPKPCTAFEGSCARFCCRVLANPRARVTWFINEQPIVPGARYKLTHDGMYHLIIPKCQLSDAGTIRVVARNLLGECQSQVVQLEVKRKVDDYRGVLKNSPNPWYDEPTLRAYRRQRQPHDDGAGDADDADEDFAEFLQNFKLQQLKMQMQQQKHQATQMGITSPLPSDSVIGYMEPETPDVNLLLSSRSPLVEPGDLHPVVVEQQVVMAPAPSTVQRALQGKDSVEVKQPQLVQHESKQGEQKLFASVNTSRSEANGNKSAQEQQQQQQRVVFGLNSTRQNPSNADTRHQQQQEARSLQRAQASSPASFAAAAAANQQQDVEHGKEVHSQTHKQFQVEHQPNREILREIIEREIFEQEHSSFSKDSLALSERSITPVRQLSGQQHANSSQSQQQQQQLETTSTHEVLIEEHMEPPEFTQKIQPCQAIDGDEAQFECAFKGDPQPKISWYCESRPIKPSNLYTIETDLERRTSKLIIRRVTMQASAVYTVKAENLAGSAKSSANLVVEPHPLPAASRGGHARQVDPSVATITSSATSSSQATASSGASGSRHLQNQFHSQQLAQLAQQHQQQLLQQGTQFTDVRGSFTANSSDDQMTISGRDTPDSSISSSTAGPNKVIKSVRTRRLSPDQMASRLRASPEGYVPPTFLQTMYDLSAKVGDVVRLDARLIGSQPMEVRWLRSGERVRPDKSHKLLLEGDLYTLLILECQLNDEAYYECCALNQVGEARCGAQLKVLSQQHPSASVATTTTTTSGQQQQQQQQQLPQLAASPATSGLFGLSTSGQQLAGQFSQMTSKTVTTTTTTSNTGAQDQQVAKMHFGLTNKPRHQHQLTYTPADAEQLATGESGSQLSMLHQQIPLIPKLIKGLESQQVAEGKSVTLRCQISAHPKAEIMWFKHGDKQIKPSKYFRIFKDNDETHCLKILETFPEDQGEYRCVARAQHGTLETSATIQVIPSSPR